MRLKEPNLEGVAPGLYRLVEVLIRNKDNPKLRRELRSKARAYLHQSRRRAH